MAGVTATGPSQLCPLGITAIIRMTISSTVTVLLYISGLTLAQPSPGSQPTATSVLPLSQTNASLPTVTNSSPPTGLYTVSSMASSNFRPRLSSSPPANPGIMNNNQPPPPPKFAEDDSYLINTDSICNMDTEPSKGGLIIGGFVQGHDEYNPKEETCKNFLNWGIIEASEVFRFGTSKLEDYTWRALSSNQRNRPQRRQTGTYIRDTCSSLLMAVAQTQTLAQDSSVFESYAKNATDATYQAANLSNLKNFTDPCKPPLIMVIGPSSSEETATISPLLSVLKIPHISFWATSTQFNNLIDYPYLLRTVPSDNHQASALADIIEYFGWTYVSLIGSSDEIYSGRGMELLREEAARRQTFCLALDARFSPREKTGIVSLAQRIKNQTESSVIVIFSTLHPAEILLKAMGNANVTGKVILGSDDWINRLSVFTQFMNNTLIGLSPEMIGTSRSDMWLVELKERMDSYQLDQNLLREVVRSNPWFQTYIEDELGCLLPTDDFHPPCEIKLDAGREKRRETFIACNLRNISWSTPAWQRAEPLMRAIELSGNAIVSLFNTDNNYEIDVQNNSCNYPRGEVMLDYIRKIKVSCDEDESGQCNAFDEYQSGWPLYKIRNWDDETRKLQVVGTWDGRRGNSSRERLKWDNEAEVHFFAGQSTYSPTSADQSQVPPSSCSRTCRPGEKRFYHRPDVATCCWQCIPCDNQTVSRGNNSDECIVCSLGEAPNDAQSACVVINAQRVSFSNPWGAVLTVFAVLGAVVSILTLAFFWRFRTCYLVRASDLYLTTAILIGVILGQVLSLLLLVEPSDVTCRLPPILTSPWAILTCAGILVKTNRFNKIFAATTRFSSRSRSKRLLMSTVTQLGAVGVLTAVALALGVIQIVVDPPKLEKTYPDSTTVYEICSVSNVWTATSLSYLCLLLFFCAILAFQTRKLPDNYNEARLIAMAAFTTCVVWLGFSPAVFITESSLRPVIMAIALVAQMWAVWTCLYVPRLVPMLRSPDVRTATKASLSKRTTSNVFRLTNVTSGKNSPAFTRITATNALSYSPSDLPPRSLTATPISLDETTTVSVSEAKKLP